MGQMIIFVSVVPCNTTRTLFLKIKFKIRRIFWFKKSLFAMINDNNHVVIGPGTLNVHRKIMLFIRHVSLLFFFLMYAFNRLGKLNFNSLASTEDLVD